jgi:hypothetical protein
MELRSCAREFYDRPSAPGDLELDPPIERIARVVGSGAHEVLPEAQP